jgi:hypothetical protein
MRYLHALGLHLTRCIFLFTVGLRRLLDGNRIGRRKGVLERFIERLFLTLAPQLTAIVPLTLLFGTDSTSPPFRGI